MPFLFAHPLPGSTQRAHRAALRMRRLLPAVPHCGHQRTAQSTALRMRRFELQYRDFVTWRQHRARSNTVTVRMRSSPMQYCRSASRRRQPHPAGGAWVGGLFLPPNLLFLFIYLFSAPIAADPDSGCLGYVRAMAVAPILCAQKVSIWGNQPQIGVGKGQGGRRSF